jgi:hypothetical protein
MLIMYEALIRHIRENTSASFRARTETHRDAERLVRNLANFGAKEGETAIVERAGEYHGLTIELLEDVKPLLTDERIIRILQILSDSQNTDFATCAKLLKVEQYFNKYSTKENVGGDDVIKYII